MPSQKQVLTQEKAELLKQKKELHEEARKILATAKESDNKFTEEQRQRLDAIDTECEGSDSKVADLDADIERLAQVERRTIETIPSSTQWSDADHSSITPHTENGPAPSGASVTPAWEKDPKKGYKDPKEFLLTVIANSRGYEVHDERLKTLVAPTSWQKYQAAAGSDEAMGSSDPHGGFLIPEGFSPDLLSIRPEEDPTSGTRRIPMTSPTVQIPARVDKNHTSSVSGGLTVARRAETAAATASRMEFEQVELKADMLIGLSYATEEILQDSAVSFVALLLSGFQDEFQARLIKERIRGLGVGEFLGILNAACTVQVAKDASQTADTIKGANIVKMRSRSWNYARSVWIANHDTLPQLAEARLPGDNSDIFLFNPSRGVDVPDTLFGRPIFFSEYASKVGDVGDLILADWMEYLEGTLQPLESAESIHVRFNNVERTFRFTVRNAGAPWWKSALTPQQSTVTLSPFVTLAERA